jgi:hypothetical protein
MALFKDRTDRIMIRAAGIILGAGALAAVATGTSVRFGDDC